MPPKVWSNLLLQGGGGVNYKLALSKIIAKEWTTKAFAFFSIEIEPRAAIAVDLQQALRVFRVEWGTLGSGENVGTGFR